MKTTKLRSGKTYRPEKKHQGRGFRYYCRKHRIPKVYLTRRQAAKLAPPTVCSDDESSDVSLDDVTEKRRNVSRLRACKTDRPTCSVFGPNRRSEYPTYRFCSKCDFWDTEFRLGNKKAQRNSVRYPLIGFSRGFPPSLNFEKKNRSKFLENNTQIENPISAFDSACSNYWDKHKLAHEKGFGKKKSEKN